MPTDAPYVAALATDPGHGQGAAARALLNRFAGSDIAVAKVKERVTAALGLPADAQLAPLLGNDLVASRTKDGTLVAWVVRDEAALQRLVRERRPSSMPVTTRGPLLLAGDPAAVQLALATKARGAGMTTRLFAARMRGLPADSLVRAESLRRLALAVSADDAGVHARMRATVAGIRDLTRLLRVGQLPIGSRSGIVHAATLRQALIERLGLPSIAELALAPLGDATFSVRRSTTGVEASGDLAVH